VVLVRNHLRDKIPATLRVKINLHVKGTGDVENFEGPLTVMLFFLVVVSATLFAKYSRELLFLVVY
jgi:hypothetical protein